MAQVEAQNTEYQPGDIYVSSLSSVNPMLAIRIAPVRGSGIWFEQPRDDPAIFTRGRFFKNLPADYVPHVPASGDSFEDVLRALFTARFQLAASQQRNSLFMEETVDELFDQLYQKAQRGGGGVEVTLLKLGYDGLFRD